MITADARIIQATQLSVNEASLTGEAMPVEKQDNELQEETPLQNAPICCIKELMLLMEMPKHW